MGSYRVGPAEFDPDAYELLIDDHVEHLQPQVRSVLLCLLRHRGEVVTKQTLLQEAWRGRHVSEECLTRCISLLREHLHDRNQKHLIETVARVGYRLNDAGLDVSTPAHVLTQILPPVHAPVGTPVPGLRASGAVVASIFVLLLLILMVITL